MRRIGAELTDLSDRGFKPGDHVVKRGSQATDFVFRRRFNTLGEIASCNPLGGKRDGVDGSQRAVGQKPAAQHAHHHCQRRADEQDEHQAGQHFFHGPEGRPDS